MLTDKRVTLAVVGLALAAMVGALFAPLDAAQKAEVIAGIGALGTALAGALRGVR